MTLIYVSFQGEVLLRVWDILLNEGSAVLFYVALNLIKITVKENPHADANDILILLREAGKNIVDADHFISECLYLHDGKKGKPSSPLGSPDKTATRSSSDSLQTSPTKQQIGIGLAHSGSISHKNADAAEAEENTGTVQLTISSLSHSTAENESENETEDKKIENEATADDVDINLMSLLPKPAQLRQQVLSYPYFNKKSLHKINDLRVLYRYFLVDVVINNNASTATFTTTSSFSPNNDHKRVINAVTRYKDIFSAQKIGLDCANFSLLCCMCIDDE